MELDDDGKRVCHPALAPNGPDMWVVKSFSRSVTGDWVGLCSLAIYRSFHKIGDKNGQRYTGELILKKVLESESKDGD